MYSHVHKYLAVILAVYYRILELKLTTEYELKVQTFSLNFKVFTAKFRWTVKGLTPPPVKRTPFKKVCQIKNILQEVGVSVSKSTINQEETSPEEIQKVYHKM